MVTDVPYTTKWTTEASTDDVLYVTFASGWRLEMHDCGDGVQVMVSVPLDELDEWEQPEQMRGFYPESFDVVVAELKERLGEIDGLDELGEGRIRTRTFHEISKTVAEHATGDEPRCVDRAPEQQSLEAFSRTSAGENNG
ncbi:hypothetical protein [Halopenitus persicus]|uniref:hypothetical protein n=1 Tax=Halopenitus persicus TaxID=1048396 RepID=UPI000BBB602C|nr:hypothetical protein [Halopenitus persicus]